MKTYCLIQLSADKKKDNTQNKNRFEGLCFEHHSEQKQLIPGDTF